jgi:hypothetical protein
MQNITINTINWQSTFTYFTMHYLDYLILNKSSSLSKHKNDATILWLSQVNKKMLIWEEKRLH